MREQLFLVICTVLPEKVSQLRAKYMHFIYSISVRLWFYGIGCNLRPGVASRMATCLGFLHWALSSGEEGKTPRTGSEYIAGQHNTHTGYPG